MKAALKNIARTTRYHVRNIANKTPLADVVYSLDQFLIGYIDQDMQTRKKAVAHAKTTDEVRRAAQGLGFTYFTDYDAQIETKHREFAAAIHHFNIDLTGKTVLDIGPGTADSLDAARTMGAAKTLFVEKEPMFVKFALAKGHKGSSRDYTFRPYFPWTLNGKVDVVYTKGSINCEWVNHQQAYREAGDARGYFNFAQWIDDIKKLLKPGSGHVILMPAMDRQPERIVDPEYDLDTYYWCPDVEKYKQGHFVQTLLGKGFVMTGDIKGFNQPKAFPLAFYYKNF